MTYTHSACLGLCIGWTLSDFHVKLLNDLQNFAYGAAEDRCHSGPGMGAHTGSQGHHKSHRSCNRAPCCKYGSPGTGAHSHLGNPRDRHRLYSFLATLSILEELNLKLEPLLASAGIAGVAIGLAAQTIVKDCLNGILILVEDQFNVGDKVRLAGLTGIVESLSLRKTTVRDGDGSLYIIPNSQITTVANLTRDYSVATINVSVDFSADPDKVLALLKEVAMGVRNDPAYSDVFISDPVLLGVDTIKGSQVIYPVQLKTQGRQTMGRHARDATTHSHRARGKRNAARRSVARLWVEYSTSRLAQ